MLLEILYRVRFPLVYTFNLVISYATYILPLRLINMIVLAKKIMSKRDHALIIVVAQIIKTEQS